MMTHDEQLYQAVMWKYHGNKTLDEWERETLMLARDRLVSDWLGAMDKKYWNRKNEQNGDSA